MALELIFMTFGGLGAGLKLHDFRWLSGGAGAEHRWPDDGIGVRAPFHQPNSFQELFNMQNRRLGGVSNREILVVPGCVILSLGFFS